MKLAGSISLSLISFAHALPRSYGHSGLVEFTLHKAAKPFESALKIPVHSSDSLVEATLSNEQYYYQIQLNIGTPAQPVNFTIDTGSSDLWVMAADNPYCTTNPANETGINCTGSVFNPERSRTFHSLGTPFEIEYGDHTMANGTMATDTVRIGNTAVLNATFAVANVVNSSTCVFGIGFIGNEAEAHVHRNGSGVYPTYFNVPTLMKEQNLISTNAYSLWLNDLNADSGSILFGGIDRAKFEGELMVMPVFNNYHEYTDRPTQTRVMLNSISADGTPLADFDIAVLLDSGTSYSYLPSEIVHSIGSALGFIYDEGVGYYFGGVDTAFSNVKKLNLNFSGAQIDVPIENLLVGLTLSDGETPLVIDGEPQAILAMGIADDDYLYILGDVFLRSMYAVFDIDHYEIALANARLNVTDSDPQTIGASIPGAIQVPNYAHTSTNNSSFNVHSFTPATPAPTALTIPASELSSLLYGNATITSAISRRTSSSETQATSTSSYTGTQPIRTHPGQSPSSSARATTSAEFSSTVSSDTGRNEPTETLTVTKTATATAAATPAATKTHRSGSRSSQSASQPGGFVIEADGEIVSAQEASRRYKNRKIQENRGNDCKSQGLARRVLRSLLRH